MPTHVYNEMEIRGSEETLISIVSRHFDVLGNLDFASIVPFPPDMEDESSQKAWAIEHWGCEYGSYDGTLSEVSKVCADVYGLSVTFYTAWTTPLEVIIALSLLYPDIRIEFDSMAEDDAGGVSSDSLVILDGIVEYTYDEPGDDGDDDDYDVDVDDVLDTFVEFLRETKLRRRRRGYRNLRLI